MEAGGCFNVECDDLQTFPVQVRNGEIWLQIGGFSYKRRDEHLRLLWEGLLSEDRWTMSKAIALLLKGGVPEEEIVEIILRHLGRHIASSHGAEGGHDVSRLINGLNIGRRYGDADRLIAVTTAACSAAGGAAERLEVLALPHPVAWEDIEQWVYVCSLTMVNQGALSAVSLLHTILAQRKGFSRSFLTAPLNRTSSVFPIISSRSDTFPR